MNSFFGIQFRKEDPEIRNLLKRAYTESTGYKLLNDNFKSIFLPLKINSINQMRAGLKIACF